MKLLVIWILLILIVPISSAVEVAVEELFEVAPKSADFDNPVKVDKEVYFYVGNQLIYANDEYVYNNRLGSNFESKSLPFGQEILNAERFSFTGKEKDKELHYFGARYYDSNLGRFTSVDPVKNNHPYTYVSNNPINLVDPDGREIQPYMWIYNQNTVDWERGSYRVSNENPPNSPGSFSPEGRDIYNGDLAEYAFNRAYNEFEDGRGSTEFWDVNGDWTLIQSVLYVKELDSELYLYEGDYRKIEDPFEEFTVAGALSFETLSIFPGENDEYLDFIYTTSAVSGVGENSIILNEPYIMNLREEISESGDLNVFGKFSDEETKSILINMGLDPSTMHSEFVVPRGNQNLLYVLTKYKDEEFGTESIKVKMYINDWLP